jgi:aryl carrier-like protein
MADVIAATEATLCQILADVLGLDVVRPQDGFFEVGGDSVRAVQVIARARAAGLVLSVRDLFDHQTAETLAVAIGGRPAASEADSVASAAVAQSPLLTFADDEFGEFGEFEDTDAGLQASEAEGEWETLT